MTELWESFIDSDPVARFDHHHGFIELDRWHEESASPALHGAVMALVEQGDDAVCSRDPGWKPGPPVEPHRAGFWLDESDKDDGVGPARFEWAPTLVRMLTAPSVRCQVVEFLCEGCVNDEIAAADAQRRCVSCWRGHHQGCGAEYTDRSESSAGSSQWCACACRAPHQRVDPPEWSKTA